jgi:hypothetical protein
MPPPPGSGPGHGDRSTPRSAAGVHAAGPVPPGVGARPGQPPGSRSPGPVPPAPHRQGQVHAPCGPWPPRRGPAGLGPGSGGPVWPLAPLGVHWARSFPSKLPAAQRVWRIVTKIPAKTTPPAPNTPAVAPLWVHAPGSGLRPWPHTWRNRSAHGITPGGTGPPVQVRPWPHARRHRSTGTGLRPAPPHPMA